MFCHKCGAQIADGAAFCHKCGTKMIVDLSVEPPGATERANTTQQPAVAPIDTQRKTKPKLPIIPIMATLAIILVVLAAIGSKSGSSTSDNPTPDDIDAVNSEASELLDNPNAPSTTDEILYAEVPVSQLIGASIDEAIDALGNPPYEYEEGGGIKFEGIEMWLNVDNIVVSLNGNGQFFTMNDQTLDKGCEEFIQMFGEPDLGPDTSYSQLGYSQVQVLWYYTNKYQMHIIINLENGQVGIDFMMPLNNEDNGDYSGGAGYNDYSNPVDLSLVGRWRSYDGGYVEFGDYGEAAVSFSPHGNLLIPDYITWEASNGRVVLTSHFSETSTYEIQYLGSRQHLNLSSNKYSGVYYTRAEAGSSLVGTWDKVGSSGYVTSNALILLSDGTGIMNRLISSSSMGDVPITWWADNTTLRIDWALQSAYDYMVSGDTLTIYFSNGSQIYSRVGN